MTKYIDLGKMSMRGGRSMELDVDVFLRTRGLIQAASGQGKSHFLRRVIEKLSKIVQVFVIDHEGEFSTLRQKFDFVLIGEGGDALPDVRTAGLLAHRLLELNASTVFDLSEAFRAHPSQRRAWVKAFLSAMMEAARRLWHPVVVVVDEAHKYCPEKDEAESAEAMTSLATDGRKRQFCALWATQRLAKLNKDAAAELLNKFIGGTSLDIDRKRAADDLGVYGHALQPFYDEIKVIDRGNFYALGPAVCKSRTLFFVGPTDTSSPMVGRRATPPPPPSARIKTMLPTLADLPKEMQKKEETERDLRGRIAELEKAVKESKRITVLDKAGAPMWTPPRRLTLEQLNEAVGPIGMHYNDRGKAYREFLTKKFAELVAHPVDTVVPRNLLHSALAKLNSPLAPSTSGKAGAEALTTRRIEAPAAPAEYFENLQQKRLDSQNGLKSGAREILKALAGRSGQPVAKSELGVITGISKRTLSDYLSTLRTRGFLVTISSSEVQITPDGMIAAGPIEAEPRTTEEILERWKPKFKAGAARMLEVLVGEYPRGLSRQELRERAGVPAERTATDYLSVLRRARLLDESGGTLKASKHLFGFVA